MASAVPDYNVSQAKSQTFGGKEKPQRKGRSRKLPISEIVLVNASTDTEITMVNQACQTDLPFVKQSPHKFKSIPLADVCHGVANDHSYATHLRDSPVVPPEQVCRVSGKDRPKSKRTLDFSKIDTSDFPQIDCQEEKIEDEWILSDVSDHEESDKSDLSDYEDNEFSESFDSEDEDFDIKTEIPNDDEEKESTNWLNEDCCDLHQEQKFLVFESKLKELFSRHVYCPNCGQNLEKASLKTKGSLATIECLGCRDQPLQWQTQPFVSSMAAGNLLFSAEILFTGNNYSNIANFTKATNVQFFSQRNFSSTQKKYLFPLFTKNLLSMKWIFLTT